MSTNSTAKVNLQRYTFIINRPCGSTINLTGFTRIFTSNALAGLALVIVLGSLVYHVSCPSAGRSGFLRSLGSVSLAYLLREGHPHHNSRISHRVLHLTVCLSGFTVFASFTGSLTSWLTAAPRGAPLNSFRVSQQYDNIA